MLTDAIRVFVKDSKEKIIVKLFYRKKSVCWNNEITMC